MTQRRKPRIRALGARRAIDLVGLRLAPALTAASDHLVPHELRARV